MEMDLKCASQASLPDAFDLKPNPLRSTKSMSGECISNEGLGVFLEQLIIQT